MKLRSWEVKEKKVEKLGSCEGGLSYRAKAYWRNKMSTVSVRLPESIHNRVKILAKREKVSINQLITIALAEKLSALDTEEYLNERAKLGDRSKFEKALSKVSDIKPEEYDRL